MINIKLYYQVGRRKELPLLEKVRITDIAAEGNALARVDNLGCVCSDAYSGRCG